MFLYNVGIILYKLTLHIASLFHPKAKLWVNGRRNWKNKLRSALPDSNNRIWVHCASLGEFEQGRPVIEKIKEQFPEYKIILSFFSPSGYENRKDYEYADHVFYLPIDTLQNAIDLIHISKPKAVIFVKYEFWINYLSELKKQQIPTYLISAVFKEHQPFFKWYGGIFRKALHTYKTIFVQDEKSLDLLQTLNIKTGMICGDTRIDRVLQIKEINAENEKVKEFTDLSFTIIAGSTWPKDNEILITAFVELKKIHSDLKLVIALHEVEESNVKNLTTLLIRSGLNYDLITNPSVNNKNDVLVINTIGILSRIYRYGRVAYVGGGFDDGIHNILEPAVQGLPVLFGPNHLKFIEADELLMLKSAYEIKNANELSQQIKALITDKNKYVLASQASSNYIHRNKGASQKIVAHVLNSLCN